MPFQPAGTTLSIPGFEAHWAHVPCHGETESGDALFEEVDRDDGRHLLLLVDVAGHGPKAARIVSVLADEVLPEVRCQGRDPGELLTILNGRLEATFAATSQFVTALAVLIEGESGTLVGGNAGQPLPQIARIGGAWAVWQVPGGAPLGVPPSGTIYHQGNEALVEGEQLLAFSDGVTEAGAKGSGVEFQHGAMSAWLAEMPARLPGGEVTARLLAALRRHVRVGWPEDDTTVVSLSRPAPAAQGWLGRLWGWIITRFRSRSGEGT